MPGKKKLEFDSKPQANTGCLRGIFYFLFISGVSLFLAIFGWNCINDVLSLTKPDKDVTVTIAEDYTIQELSRTLADLGVIDRPWLFTLFCNFSNAGEKIEPGAYTISCNLDYNAIVKSFVTVTVRDEVWVVIPEGKTVRETLELLAEAGVCPLEDLLREAEEGEFPFGFLEDIPPGPGRLEGYLFPNTYVFYTNWNPRSTLLKLLNSFDAQLQPSVYKRLNNIDYDLNEIMTIASLIQMEAANNAEMHDISAVIWNRLGSTNLKKLELDATSVYLIGKENVHSAADVMAGRQIDSPYNTFLYEGLPPGPICSPSAEAIRAALYPYNTKNYFYALHQDRSHRFFSSDNEFRRFINSADFADF